MRVRWIQEIREKPAGCKSLPNEVVLQYLLHGIFVGMGPAESTSTELIRRPLFHYDLHDCPIPCETDAYRFIRDRLLRQALAFKACECGKFQGKVSRGIVVKVYAGAGIYSVGQSS